MKNAKSPTGKLYTDRMNLNYFLARCACSLLSADFLLGLLFNPEDNESTSLQNSGELLPDYTVLHPRRQYSSIFYYLYRKTFKILFPTKE
jgi:hypothetical protein